jgi:hypothetical protein
MVTERKPVRRARKAPLKAKKPFDAFAYIAELGAKIPAEELAKLPRDLAENFDHYHDGSPKQR